MLEETMQVYQENVDKKLIIRQRLFLVIICILIIIGIVNILQGHIGKILAMSGFTLATIIGLLLSRMFKIFWHQEKAKVVSRLDTVGTIVLIVYMFFEVERSKILGFWLSGVTLTSFSLIVLTGLLLGRFLGTFLKIQEVLMEKVDK